MRITAFGPFADTVDIDVDALSDQGLFLLTGPTGAGKTSVLDAVCFGLFGQVPGARQQADRLRSDHAAAGVGPEVRLEVTLGGRRLRLLRSPRWRRPSRRARSGFTTQQASVVLQEHIHSTWQTLTTRIDEAQLLLDELLGMNVSQFTQVAMLPQGQFQQFLRAGADERRRVLERLFGTQRFREVERWLVEHRAATRGRAESAEQAARSAADRLHGAAHLESTVPEDQAEWTQWADRVVAAAAGRRDDLSVLAEQSRDLRHTAHREHRLGVELTAARVRGQQARQRLAHHSATQADADARAATLQAADRAREVAALLAPFRDASARAGDAVRAAVTATTQLHEVLPDLLAGLPSTPDAAAWLDAVDADRLTGWLTTMEAERTRTDRAVERELRLAADVEGLAQLEHEATSARESVLAAEQAAAGLRTSTGAAPQTSTDLHASISADGALAATHDHVAAALAGARRQAGAASLLPDAQAKLCHVETAARKAFAAYRTAAGECLDIARRRLAGAAAELARGLVDDVPCQVCGSRAHPDPAAAEDDHPGEADEAAAQRREAAADERREEADTLVAMLGGEVARLRAVAGERSQAEADRAVVELAAQLDAAVAACARLPRCQELLAETEAANADASEQLQVADQQVRDCAAVESTVRAAAAASRARLVEVLGESLDITAAQRHTRRCHDALTAALPVASELGAARAAQGTARDHADRAGRTHGFADAEEAQAAVLDEPARDELRAGLERRQHEQASDTAVLADSEVATALTANAPDVAGLAAAADSAEQLHDRHRAQQASADRSAGRLVQLRAELRARLAAWRPRQDEHHVAAGLAALAEGKSADNEHRMSLSSYVLAARLEQVVAAANERLSPMTSGRYVLEHTVDKSAGDRRAAAGGLGLRVRDEWTGERRDPATLSGGETFQASLALALGLSDVVAHECGGTQLQTIFVDEGFGSLDADSLDEVMDELDRLRDGGRVVGLVSHVDAMRERIPAQLRLVKTRTGSTVACAS